MISRLVDGLNPIPICHPDDLQPPLSKKNKMLIFGWLSTSGDRPGWSMDSNPICHHSPAKKMKCSFLDYIQLLMIGRAGPWTQTLSTTPLQPKKWNAHFWITFNFWWLAGLVNGLEPHLPPLSSQKNKMLIFGLQFWWSAGLVDGLEPHLPPLPAKKMMIWWSAGLVDGLEPHLPPLSSQKNKMLIFWITFNFWWSAGLVDGLEPHPPQFSSQKNKILVLELCTTSGVWPGWSIDSNPIHHPSPAKKIKSSFLDYIQLLMIGQAGWWTRIPSATPLQPNK